MKKTVVLAGALCASMSFAAVAADAGRTYFGAGVNLWDISVGSSFGSGSAEPRGIEGRYGYFFSNNLAVEGRLGLGVSDDSNVEISRNFGIYLKGVVDAGMFQPYAFLGYTDLELEVGNLSETDNDMSFGIGAMFGSGSTRFSLEWARLYSDSADGVDLDIDSVQLGIVSTF